MKTYSSEEVMEHIKEKQANAPKPKMVFEVDYRRLQKVGAKDKKRLEACIDALLLDLAGVKDALRYVEFCNKENEKKIQKQKNRLIAYEPIIKTQIALRTSASDATRAAAAQAIDTLMEKIK